MKLYFPSQQFRLSLNDSIFHSCRILLHEFAFVQQSRDSLSWNLRFVIFARNYFVCVFRHFNHVYILETYPFMESFILILSSHPHIGPSDIVFHKVSHQFLFTFTTTLAPFLTALDRKSCKPSNWAYTNHLFSIKNLLNLFTQYIYIFCAVACRSVSRQRPRRKLLYNSRY